MTTDVIFIDITAAASLGSAESALEAAALAVMAMDPSLQPEDGEPGEWMNLSNETKTRLVQIDIS